MPTISVILPIYNMATFLAPCLESVLAQTYTDLEILLVDDGSTDASPEICREYARRDPRVRVLRQENGGVSRARNAGLDAACGEYVTFVDPDDLIAPDYCQRLLELLEENGADISKCLYRQFPDGETPDMTCPEGTVQVYEGDPGLLFRLPSLESSPMKLYRRSLFADVRFPALASGEDSWLIMDLLRKKPRLVYDTTPRYFYRIHGASATQRPDRRQLDRIPAFAHWVEVAEAEYPGDGLIFPCAVQRYLEESLGAITRTYALLSPTERRARKARLYEDYRRLSAKTALPKSLKLRLHLLCRCTPAYLALKRLRRKTEI